MYLATIVNIESQEEIVVYGKDIKEFHSILDYVEENGDYEVEHMLKQDIVFGLDGLKEVIEVST